LEFAEKNGEEKKSDEKKKRREEKAGHKIVEGRAKSSQRRGR